jgi:hypothetical protein
MSITRAEFLPEPQNQRVIIVANGPSANEHQLGAKIDGYDIVVRINNYLVRGHEKEVGQRTDVWVNGANKGLKIRRQIPKKIVVMIPPVVLAGKADWIHNRVKRRLGTEHYYLVPLNEMEVLEATAGISRPTTGLFSILYFTSLGYDVTIHGFNFFQGGTHHYFDSIWMRWLKRKGILRKGGKHALDAEKAFVEGLVSVGKLRYLMEKPL